MPSHADWSSFAVYACACAFAVFASLSPILIGWYRTRRQRSFMQAMSRRLAFSYSEGGGRIEMRAAGLSRGRIVCSISGMYDGTSVGAFTYRILTGGKSRYWSYMTVFQTHMPVSLPDTVLRPIRLSIDVAANAALERTALFSEYEEVHLEGNFGKYFKLYTAKGAHIEALEIFSPDVMEDMIAHYRSYGIEFSNDILYLYPMTLIGDEASFLAALALLVRLANDLSPTFRGMAAAPTLDPAPR